MARVVNQERETKGTHLRTYEIKLSLPKDNIIIY